MEKKEEFVVGMTVGGMLILAFYGLLFFPVIWLYTTIPVDYRSLLKYILAVLFTIMLINSARGAYQSLKIIKQHECVMKKIQESTQDKVNIQSYIHEGLKCRLLIELALF